MRSKIYLDRCRNNTRLPKNCFFSSRLIDEHVQLRKALLKRIFYHWGWRKMFDCFRIVCGDHQKPYLSIILSCAVHKNVLSDTV